MSHGFSETRFHNGGLEVIGHEARGHTPEELKGMAVTQQPRLDALIPHQFGVLMSAPREHHREHPRFAGASTLRVQAQPGIAKVHLRLTARLHLHAHDRLLGPWLQVSDQAADRAVAHRMLMGLFQARSDRRHLHPHLPVRLHLLYIGSQRGHLLRGQHAG